MICFRFFFQHILYCAYINFISQSTNESQITSETANALVAILVDRLSTLLSRARRNEQRTDHVELYAFFTGGKQRVFIF